MNRPFKSAVHSIHDRSTGIKRKIQGKKYDGRDLCHDCGKIPFKDLINSDFDSPPGFSSSSATSYSSGSESSYSSNASTSYTSSPTSSYASSPTIALNEESQAYCLNLDKVLANRTWCKFCAVLFKTICRQEYDILQAEHISKHLETSEKLKDIKKFSQWLETFSSWEKLVDGADIWPFGYTRDQNEAQRDGEAEAIKLFNQAENKDLKSGVLDGQYKTHDEVTMALGAISLVGGVAGMTGMIEDSQALAGLQTLTSSLAMFSNARARRLPCLFIVRPYQRDEAKAGVLSIRVYGHGRAFHAPLKEICHFSYRLEHPNVRPEGQQIWYGRPLESRIELPFFAQCLSSCRSLHGDGCDKSVWQSASGPSQLDSFPFRLINVETMQVEEIDFRQVYLPNDDSQHISYVTLSYTWGQCNWTEHLDEQGFTFYYEEHSQISTYNRDAHSGLTRANLNGFQTPGGLEDTDIYVPQTVKDAIAVCKGMGERYLWVDKLCIIQEEGDSANISNIQNMGRIYAEATFTIVAGDSTTSNSGMVGVSTDRTVPDQLMETILGRIRMFLPVAMKQTFDPWDTRAWTFQEKLFSKRMLLISGGFAIWKCRGAIWREDVNALDCNGEKSFDWPELLPDIEAEGETDNTQLQLFQQDDSVRLFRSPAFCQYAKLVEDFGGRFMTKSWTIMDAFEGIRGILESPRMLNSALRFGLPSRAICAALLWQPSEPACRREDGVDDSGVIVRRSPPSWSWAGWVTAGDNFQGIKVTFPKPFEVMADEKGLLMNSNPLGEERIRPIQGRIYGVAPVSCGGIITSKLVELGMFKRDTLNQVSRDWECSPQNRRLELPPKILGLSTLNERHIVLNSEITTIWLGLDVYRVRKRVQVGGKGCIRETIESHNPLGPDIEQGTEVSDVEAVSSERQILASGTGHQVGTVKLDSGEKYIEGSECQAVTAVVLSEAQYMGDEVRVDVLGYPIYNIILVNKGPNGVSERIGVGKIYKSAWRKELPIREVVILE